MNTVVLLSLGFMSAMVVVLTVVMVMLMLKVGKLVKNLGEVAEKVKKNALESERLMDDVYRQFDGKERDTSDLCKTTLQDAKSYTDSRFDKLSAAK